jgi:hypothetical protein
MKRASVNEDLQLHVNAINKRHRLWQATVTRCFATSPEITEPDNNKKPRYRNVGRSDRELMIRSRQRNHIQIHRRGLIESSNISNQNRHYEDYSYEEHEIAVPNDNSTASEQDDHFSWRSHTFTTNYKYELRSSDDPYARDLIEIPPLKTIDFTTGAKRYFQAKNCLGKAASETLKSLNDAFQNEIHQFLSCSYRNSTGK